MQLLRILIFALFSVAVLCEALISNSTVTTTTLRPTVERIFSRKKRFLLMPKKSNLKFTANLSKRLLGMIPRGLNFAIDVAFYYPMVSNVYDATPKRLRPPTTTTPKPKGTTEPLLVYIPGTFIRYKAKPAAKPDKLRHQRIDTIGNAAQWIEPQKHASYEKYTNPNKWLKWSKYGTPEYAQKYEWTPAKTKQQYQWKPKQQAKWTKWATTTPLPWGRQQQAQPQQQQWWATNANNYDEWPRRGRWGRALHRPFSDDEPIDAETAAYADIFDQQLMYFADLEPYADWKHYHSHRDRRQLFHQFDGLSKFLGIDMKSCILRAICDSKRFLLPPGYSMIQDILRVVFTFPTISGMEDDYSRVMQTDFETCEKNLKSSCPLNMLHWLMGPEKEF